MFLDFFYHLRYRGIDVSINEWMLLIEALSKGLHNNSFTGFYNLCRAVLIKSEADFDKFDKVFMEYFKDVPYTEEIPDELMSWLNKSQEEMAAFKNFLKEEGYTEREIQDIIDQFLQRLEEQKEEHNGGSKWIGTQGYTNFGNAGHLPQGIRVGGQSVHRRAFEVMGERKYRDFRKDNTLDTRQFQMAFRTLRQFSAQSNELPTEFDVDGTIRKTCDNAGRLEVEYKKPRSNSVKLLMFMDSGGSMYYYAGLCSMLFQAASKERNFKDLKIYYFHNCIYENVYTSPRMFREDSVPTEWILGNYPSDYKVIMVGDALMSMYELMDRRWNFNSRSDSPAGYEWLTKFKSHFDHIIWLNPEGRPYVTNYWGQSYLRIADLFPMFPLTVEGMEQGMKKLLVNR